MSLFYQGLIIGVVLGFFASSFLFGLVFTYIEHTRMKIAKKNYDADVHTYRVVREKKP